MIRRLVIAVTIAASAATGLLTAAAGSTAVGSAPRGPLGCGRLAAAGRGGPGLASGRGLWAVDGGTLVSVGADRRISRAQVTSLVGPASFEGGVIKHVAVRPGVGTAFVIDRPGSDTVVAVTPAGVAVMPQSGEASGPAWARSGRLAWSTGSAVLVRDPTTGRIHRIPSPIRDAHVFAPAFVSDRRLTAVVTLPTKGGVFEGERVGDLWTADLRGPTWHRVTRFRTTSDRWVTIRTPIARAGGVDFVRISGRGTSTQAPRFELWRYFEGSAFRVHPIDGERYLAGTLAGRLVWNRPDPFHGRFLLQVPGRGGMRTIGCGAVMVDPIDVVDPDRRGGGSLGPARGSRPPEVPIASGSSSIAVIVGDFPTRTEAEEVAARIRYAYPGSSVDVVDSGDSPNAIRPGVFGALLHLTPGVDATAALASFRAAL
ncbi:MAG TPA: hypothetical protein VFA25_00605, partial [Actinomycetota bacterium]|nr:hypothetical protein [Actinomycetota bacterium]